MLYAHLCRASADTGYRFELRVTDSVRPIGGKLYMVDSKREARKFASELGAKCWNF